MNEARFVLLTSGSYAEDAALTLQQLLLTAAAKPINLMSSTAFETLTEDLWRAKGTM